MLISCGAWRTESALVVLTWVSEPADRDAGQGRQLTFYGSEFPGRNLSGGPAGLPEVTPQLLCKCPFQFKLQPPTVLSTGPGPRRTHSTVAQDPLLPESCPDHWPTDCFPFNLQSTCSRPVWVLVTHCPAACSTTFLLTHHTLVPHWPASSTSSLKVCALSLALPCP